MERVFSTLTHMDTPTRRRMEAPLLKTTLFVSAQKDTVEDMLEEAMSSLPAAKDKEKAVLAAASARIEELEAAHSAAAAGGGAVAAAAAGVKADGAGAQWAGGPGGKVGGGGTGGEMDRSP